MFDRVLDTPLTFTAIKDYKYSGKKLDPGSLTEKKLHRRLGNYKIKLQTANIFAGEEMELMMK